MCVVSMIVDDWTNRKPWDFPINDDWKKYVEDYYRNKATADEVEKLRKEVEALKKLVKAAKEYDKDTGQPDCEMASKVRLIKEIAKLVGVSMEDVFAD